MTEKQTNALIVGVLSAGLIGSIALAALKLAHIVAVSWWLVPVPFLAPFLLIVAMVIFVMFNIDKLD